MRALIRRKRTRRRKAFSLVELLTAILILGILGGSVLLALWFFFGMYYQTEENVSGRQEIEYVFQTIGRQIANVSLGMPNNRGGDGSFAVSFQSVSGGDPIMAFMGEDGARWGGPITLASCDTASSADLRNFSKSRMVTSPVSGSFDVYVGPQVFYAWGVPVHMPQTAGGELIPVRMGDPADPATVVTGEMSAGDRNTFRFVPDGAVAVLEENRYQYDGYSSGIEVSNGRSTRSWVVFPSVRIPMLVVSIDKNADRVTMELAPGSDISGKPPMRQVLGGYEEVHLVQVCRLYVNEREELIQEFFGSNPSDASTSNYKTLARKVVGMCFRYDAGNRLLTMCLAIRGDDDTVLAGAGSPSEWPDFAPPLPAEALKYRIVAQSITWRIRN